MRIRLAVVAFTVVAVAVPSSGYPQAGVAMVSTGARIWVVAGLAVASDSEIEDFLVVSSTDYPAIIDGVNGAQPSLPRSQHISRLLGRKSLTESDSTGSTCVRVEFGGVPTVGDLVFPSRNTDFYAPTGAVSGQMATRSTIEEIGNCANFSATETLIQIVPNDTAAARFASSGDIGALRLGFLARELHADRFKTA